MDQFDWLMQKREKRRKEIEKIIIIPVIGKPLPPTVQFSHHHDKLRCKRVFAGTNNQNRENTEKIDWNQTTTPLNREDLLREMDLKIFRRHRNNSSNSNTCSSSSGHITPCPVMEQKSKRRSSIPNCPRINTPHYENRKQSEKQSKAIHEKRWNVESKLEDDVEHWKMFKKYPKDHDTFRRISTEFHSIPFHENNVFKEKSVSSLYN